MTKPTVTQADAIKFLENACRNWEPFPALTFADVEDVRIALAAHRKAAIKEAVEAMRRDPFCDDACLLGTSQQDARMEHYARIALTSAKGQTNE